MNADTLMLRKIAMLNASASRALIQAAGMTAHNQTRRADELIYEEADFQRVIDDNCLGWNEVIAALDPNT